LQVQCTEPNWEDQFKDFLPQIAYAKTETLQPRY